MSTRPKVALCFFGLVKNYELVASSVEQYVLHPLRKAGYCYDVYIHTYQQTVVHNDRNQERNASIYPSSIARYFPQATIRYDTPATADRVHPLDFYLQRGDPWPDNPRISMTNYARQLYSLKAVTALWLPHTAEYTYVIYLRPDVCFTMQLPLLPLREKQIAIPRFHSFKGCNDRFAYGRPATMKLYGSRMNWLGTFFTSQKSCLHAERYLAFFLRAHQVEVVPIPFHFIRIRANGHENVADREARAQA
jgi:hypothetical protein